MTATLSTSNLTIDDEYGDSVTGQKPLYYSPGPEGWAQGSICSRCYIHLDPTQVYNGTWHDATYYQMNTSGTPSTVTLQFTGIAVYVYGVLANQVSNTYTQTFLDFTLDDAPQQSFEHDPTSSTEFTYNALVFSKTGLDNTEHTLHILLHPPPLTNSLFLLDYVVYTVVDQMTNSSSSSASMTSTTSSPPVSTTNSALVHWHMPTTNSTSIHTSTTNSTSVHTPSTLVSLPLSTRSSSSTSPAQSPSFSPTGPSQHKNPLPVRIVIVVVAGGTALAIGIVIVALYLHRRRRSPLCSRVEPWRLYEKGRPVLSIGGASECTQRSRREPAPLPGSRGDAGPSTSQPLPPIASTTIVSNLHTEVTALREVMERLRGILGAETRSSLPPPLYEETAELGRAI